MGLEPDPPAPRALSSLNHQLLSQLLSLRGTGVEGRPTSPYESSVYACYQLSMKMTFIITAAKYKAATEIKIEHLPAPGAVTIPLGHAPTLLPQSAGARSKQGRLGTHNKGKLRLARECSLAKRGSKEVTVDPLCPFPCWLNQSVLCGVRGSLDSPNTTCKLWAGPKQLAGGTKTQPKQ